MVLPFYHLHSKCQTNNESKGEGEDPEGLEWCHVSHVLA